MTLAVRAAAAVVVLLGGAGAALCTVALHTRWWGLAIGLAATAATLVALPGGWWRRLPFALGWAGAVAVLTPERPEGDFLVASNLPGYVVLVAAPVVLVAGLVGLRASPRADAADGPQDDTISAVQAPSS